MLIIYVVDTMKKSFGSQAKTDSIPNQHLFTQLLSDPNYGEKICPLFWGQRNDHGSIEWYFSEWMSMR
ncbi:MAG: hypothetical protein IPL23_21515 [Saprospiraceae bacterium]|nr:hypothetical protein [Saprospiraceae bacterium]